MTEIKVGVPKKCVRGPVLYLITSNIISLSKQTIAKFADDTAIMAIADNYYDSLMKVRNAINCIKFWTIITPFQNFD